MADRLPLPVGSAVLLADQIIVESGTSKKTLVGIYSTIYTSHLPARRHLNIYAEVTDAEGRYDFTLELLHLEANACVAQGEMEDVTSGDRLTPLEMVIRLPVAFAEYGTYEFRIAYEGNVFASRVLRVLPAPHPRPEGAPDRPEPEIP
jgi:hypothetical protein